MKITRRGFSAVAAQISAVLRGDVTLSAKEILPTAPAYYNDKSKSLLGFIQDINLPYIPYSGTETRTLRQIGFPLLEAFEFVTKGSFLSPLEPRLTEKTRTFLAPILGPQTEIGSYFTLLNGVSDYLAQRTRQIPLNKEQIAFLREMADIELPIIARHGKLFLNVIEDALKNPNIEESVKESLLKRNYEIIAEAVQTQNDPPYTRAGLILDHIYDITHTGAQDWHIYLQSEESGQALGQLSDASRNAYYSLKNEICAAKEAFLKKHNVPDDLSPPFTKYSNSTVQFFRVSNPLNHALRHIRAQYEFPNDRYRPKLSFNYLDAAENPEQVIGKFIKECIDDHRQVILNCLQGKYPRTQKAKEQDEALEKKISDQEKKFVNRLEEFNPHTDLPHAYPQNYRAEFNPHTDLPHSYKENLRQLRDDKSHRPPEKS